MPTTNIDPTVIQDYRWMAGGGGVLMDASGDIDLTASNIESVKDIIQSRLKADYLGWALYPFGADLQKFIGQVIDSDLETSICRRVTSSLTYEGFLSPGVVTVKTLVTGDILQVFIYVIDTLVAQGTLTKTGSSLTVVVL